MGRDQCDPAYSNGWVYSRSATSRSGRCRGKWQQKDRESADVPIPFILTIGLKDIYLGRNKEARWENRLMALLSELSGRDRHQKSYLLIDFFKYFRRISSVENSCQGDVAWHNGGLK
jgi:hypothetical protein